MAPRLTPAASRAPRPVEAGDTLYLVAPAGPFDREDFEAGVAWLRTHFEVRYDPSIIERHGFCAGDDERRQAELEAALASDAHAILAARGGYGCTRLLPALDLETIRRANKPLIGFSDLSALHAAWHRAGVGSWHAPMVAWLGRADDDARSAWRAELAGAPLSIPLTPLTQTRAIEGVLVGGNLAVLAALLGTPYLPAIDGAILFLEEIGEAPYRIDRMLTSLGQAGWLGRAAGLLLGDLHACEGRHAVDAVDVFRAHAERWNLPAWRGVPSGHTTPNRALPFGATVTVEADRLRYLA